jgi:2-oxoglutarate dehydrogenase E2 component (dihydrolipoamide succinyltransferase)
MTTTFRLQPLGEDVSEVTVARWLKKPGEPVRAGEPVLEVETDKITLEVTADASGTLAEASVQPGQKVKVGDVLGAMADAAEPAPAEPAAAAFGASISTPSHEGMQLSEQPSESSSPRAQTRISPVVSRMAAEHHIDLRQIQGTGEGGRITKQDVLAFIEKRQAQPAPWTTDDGRQTTKPASSSIVYRPLSSEEGELIPLTPMRARIAEHMLRSVQTSPHVTTVFEFDFSAVSAHRAANKDAFERDGVHLTYLAYLVDATAQALKQHPMVNSMWRESGILLKREINIGIAVALNEGLIVPVIHHADELSLSGIARKTQELAGRARSGQLQPHETQGGTFSITNHGASGSLLGTPIIVQPQSGILGFGAIEKRAKMIDGPGGDAIAIRPCAYISFSFDHRILDGATADAFVVSIKDIIENWR